MLRSPVRQRPETATAAPLPRPARRFLYGNMEKHMPDTLASAKAAQEGKHKNDTYGSMDHPKAAKESRPATPAATVVLLRDAAGGPEVLMLRKNSKIAFGGMWVFPGGRIDAEDYPEDGDQEAGARRAAAREAEEEAGIDVNPADCIWFAHWTPPPGVSPRFATWFFAARANDQAITIDDGEIKEHQWIRPADALMGHGRHEIDLAPPTWVTLYHVSLYQPVDALLRRLSAQPARCYATRVAQRSDGVRVAMWAGDAGYDDWDADRAGARHRLVMPKAGFALENDCAQY